MIKNGAQIIFEELKRHRVKHIFGYPGGAVLPLYDELFKLKGLQHILVRHEQGAMHAAEGYARSSGKPGVVLVTSGPGATNTVTGLADAFMDSIPLVCLAGQVPTHMIGNDAFQEADTLGITRPCTKHNYLAANVGDLARIMREAFHVATSGRPGPVLIDIPKDVQIATCDYQPLTRFRHRTYNPPTKAKEDSVAAAVKLIVKAKKPLLYSGGGVINGGDKAVKELRALVKFGGLPITQTLMGLGAIPHDDPHNLGMVGMHGTYEANLAMHGCDLMICVGARFDDRVTGNLKSFSPKSKKIHIDVDSSSIGKNVKVDVALIGDSGHCLQQLNHALKGKKLRNYSAWKKQIQKWRRVKCLSYINSKKVIKPQYALQRLDALTANKNTYITTEVGQHQMWAAQFLRFNRPRHWMTSGGLGTMGYGFPAAIGVQIAHPRGLVIDVAGEASFLMNLQELSTAVQYRLPVKVFILNNRYMGMVRQWQELIYSNRLSESYMDALPDFVKLAEAFGADGLRIEDPKDVDDGIRQMIASPKPMIVDVAVDPNENCFPMIPAGAAHNEMLLGDGVKQPRSKRAKGKTAQGTEEGMVLV